MARELQSDISFTQRSPDMQKAQNNFYDPTSAVNSHYPNYYTNTNGYPTAAYDPQAIGAYGYNSQQEQAYRNVSCVMGPHQTPQSAVAPPAAHHGMDYAHAGYMGQYPTHMGSGGPMGGGPGGGGSGGSPPFGSHGMAMGGLCGTPGGGGGGGAGAGLATKTEIYPWMKESRQNNKQRSQTQSPEETGTDFSLILSLYIHYYFQFY